MVYLIIEAYYKNGETFIKFFKKEWEVREYINIRYKSSDELNFELYIKNAIDYGKKRISEELGIGIVNVIECENPYVFGNISFN